MESWHGTTILGVRKGGKTVIAGDGQVSMGNTVMKPNAKKVRRIGEKGDVIGGFAGATADAFTLFERLERKLEQYNGQLMRAAVELAKDWRTDKYLRNLEALMIRWIDEAGVTARPTACFGLVLVGASICYVLLERALVAAEGDGSGVKTAVGRGVKEWVSFAGYLAALPLAFVSPFISIAIYVAVGFLWLVPDRRFERRLQR